ncbi:MAG: hypothetical protein P8I99_01100 [Acidimicrobiales bacterium]|nr:hypothetical protein [Acidimicrobiales bacterium]MDG1875995.1 hypothetical protein [Acidimicrobiales bacterium]
MSLVVCPNCEEDEDLDGDDVDGTIHITCASCGATWERNLTPRCATCGRTDLRDALEAILDKSRGTQLSIQAMKVIWLCHDCDAEKLRRWLDSNVPLPPDTMPVDPR